MSNSHNLLLANLPSVDFDLLRPHLKTAELAHQSVLYEPGDIVSKIYFPHAAVISLVVTLTTGEMVEAAMVGRDGMVGALAAFDGPTSVSRMLVQVQGAASMIEAEQFRRVAERSEALRKTIARHEQALFAQTQQAVACNVTHPIETRMARWLLRARDLSGKDVLPLTQEFLAEMLGVRRSSVSVVAHTLQQAGLIKYRRGLIQIVDLEGLQEASCECYETVKGHYDRLLGWTAN